MIYVYFCSISHFWTLWFIEDYMSLHPHVWIDRQQKHCGGLVLIIICAPTWWQIKGLSSLWPQEQKRLSWRFEMASQWLYYNVTLLHHTKLCVIGPIWAIKSKLAIRRNLLADTQNGGWHWPYDTDAEFLGRKSRENGDGKINICFQQFKSRYSKITAPSYSQLQ